jgi:predicted deacylase
MRPSIEPVLGVQGVVRVSAMHAPGPSLAIVGAIHGNEQCGLRAIERLQKELSDGTLRLTCGTLFLVHGNPAASEERRRHTGVDLNRMFDYRFVDELSPSLWEREHHRALELRPIFEAADAVLDLHSATADTPAFAIASAVPASARFAEALGLGWVTTGWDGPGLLGDQVLLAQMTRRNLPGVAVECGQHDDPRAPECAYRCARRALSYFGLTEPYSAPEQPQITRLHVLAAIKRPSAGFFFSRPLHGMQELTAGEEIGRDGHLLLSLCAPCVVLMPNDRVAVGEDMLYIATRPETSH